MASWSAAGPFSVIASMAHFRKNAIDMLSAIEASTKPPASTILSRSPGRALGHR